ncbi:MAG: fatty acid--CoA ligase family protein [Pseudomonadota bacterium]
MKQHAEKVALVDQSGEHDYQTLIDQIDTYYNELSMTVSAGDSVAILSDYSFQSVALFLALTKLKTIIIPIVTKVEDEISERLEEGYVDWVLNLSDKLIINSRASKEKHHLIQTLQQEKKAGLILFSSGSTGKPKAMIHNLDNLIDSYKGRKPKKLSILVFLMFDHIGGLNTLLNSLTMGAKIIIPGTRDADEVSQLIEKYKVNVLPASPTFLNLMLIGNTPERYDLSSLKMITYGTEAMPESLLLRLKKTFPKVRFLQTFGTSETGIAQTTSRSSTSLEIKLGDPNQEYKIVDGELWLRSKTQVLGYLNVPMNSFTEDGWFKTGDLVEETEDGFLKIVGRNKEIINVGGEKVLPVEVESVLLEMEDINDCMVYGEKNAITGQTVVVDVVPSQLVDKKTIKKAIRQYCRERLDGYKIPTKINIMERTNFGDRFKKLRLK